jgi:hypothetical protein
MLWMALNMGLERLTAIAERWRDYPEAVLLAGIMAFLLLRSKFRASLLLFFGIMLCFANYFVLKEQVFLLISPLYAVGFGAISVILLLLLLYEFIHTV